MKQLFVRNWLLYLLAVVATVLTIVCVQAANSPRLSAQPVPVCRAAMVVDRSGSVTSTDLRTLRNQILYLFQIGGLHDPSIHLGFWSFSSSNGLSNYNAPFHDFVSSVDGDLSSNFRTELARLTSSGNTDYEQGLGYHNGVLNSFNGMNRIIENSDVIVFMTDGVPNVPGSSGNKVNAARQAVLKHKSAGRVIVGGIIGSASQRSLNFVINGSETNSTNIVKISTNYSNLSDKLKEVIGAKCDELFPPEPSLEYDLIPQARTDDSVIAGTTGATFTYNVKNTSTVGSSTPTDWEVKRVFVNRNQSVDPLLFSSPEYKNGMSCDQIESLLGGRGQCEDDIARGQKVFVPGDNPMNLEVGGATRVMIDDEWEVGRKVCYILTITKPTQAASPTNRFSRAACITVGKYPSVQVHGDDVWVGRRFTGDTVPENTEAARNANIRTSVTSKNDGKTYGSWAEYGVFATGTVSGFGSLSGLQGGFEGLADQGSWSKLTFANIGGVYGGFEQSTVADPAATVLAGKAVDREWGDDTINFNDAPVGETYYRKLSGGMTINGSVIDKGRIIYVNIPNGTATIDGNLDYAPGDYGSIGEIPKLIIIAKNIVIKPSVTNIDAWLITTSQQGGTITTCDDPRPLTSEVCNAPLKINGAVAARQIDLRRTGGAGRGGAADDPAEIINLRADSYLWPQGSARTVTRATTSNTVELPPYF